MQTCPWTSSTNGKAESQNKSIYGSMRAALTPAQYTNWDLHLKYIVISLNWLKSLRAGVSANYLLFGRNLRPPQVIFLKIEETESYKTIFGDVKNMKKRAAYD